MGMISAVFHSSGTVPEVKLSLKISATMIYIQEGEEKGVGCVHGPNLGRNF
jgi:hypothetical protein